MERFIVSNNPFEPTKEETYGSDEPTYIQPPPPPHKPSGPYPYQQSTEYSPPPPGPYPYQQSTEYSPPPSEPNPYQQSATYPPPPPYETSASQTPSPRKDRKTPPWIFVIVAVIVIVVLVIGGLSWFLTRSNTTSSSGTALVPKGEVHFLDSPDMAPGATNALKITATGLSNPPDGSEYDAWLVDTASEQILPLGTLNKSNSTTFAVSYSNPSGQSPTNLVGAGNKIEVTQEQGTVTAPAGKIVLSATFPPLAFIHIRHLLFKFPTTPGNIGLLPGLINETQKVNSLSQLLQNDATNTTSVTCIAQAIINVIEGQNGTNFHALAAKCANVGIGNALIGDGFGLLGNGYLSTASAHAALAASQSDTTETIRLNAKDVERSTDSIKDVVKRIDSDASQLMANPATTTPISEMVSLSDHAYHGFDQNGNGIIEPIVGEAGALTAYASGQHMATLALAQSS